MVPNADKYLIPSRDIASFSHSLKIVSYAKAKIKASHKGRKGNKLHASCVKSIIYSKTGFIKRLISGTRLFMQTLYQGKVKKGRNMELEVKETESWVVEKFRWVEADQTEGQIQI